MAKKQSTRPVRVVAEGFVEEYVHCAFESYLRVIAQERPRGRTGSAVVAFTDALRRRLESMEAAERANGWRSRPATAEKGVRS